MLVAGWAKRDITPEGRCYVAGYDDRTRFQEGVADRLFARAVWLGDGRTRWMLIHLDVIALEGSYVRGVRAELADAFGLAPEEVMIACSHTHSGPGGLFRFEGEEAVLRPSFGPYIGDYDPRYAEQLRSTILAVAGDALRRRVHVRARVEVKTAPRGLFANRRRPDGPVDLSLPVVRLVEDSDDAGDPPDQGRRGHNGAGRTLVVIANVSCHPTVLGRSSRMISADFPGRVAARIEDRLSGGSAGDHAGDSAADRPCLAVVTTGAAGDVSTRFTRVATGVAECDRVSEALAALILGDNEQADGLSQPSGTDYSKAGREEEAGHEPVDAALTAFLIRVELPLKPVPDSGTCREGVERAKARLSELTRSGASEAEIRSAETELEGQTIMLQRALLRDAGKARADVVEVEVQKLCLGDTALVGLPCELFSELGMRLRRNVSPGTAMVVAYANGYVGYVPTEAAYDEGGYEVMTSILRRGAGEQLVDAAVSNALTTSARPAPQCGSP